MTRFIIIFLLLIVFFFSGVFYGNMDDKNVEQDDRFIEEVNLSYENEHIIQGIDIIPFENDIENNELDRNHSEQSIHKTASFLERIVNGFYEAIIAVIYGIANLFY